jgi:hypothetical protein
MKGDGLMLYSMFQNNKDEFTNKWVHFFPVYERYFKDFVNKSIVMIEIGVSFGGSLKMWKKYLGPFATIIGIDINPKCIQYEDEQCKVRIGSQSDLKFLSGIVNEFGAPDIILDDGSHKQEDMEKTFNFLYPLLNNNGVYIVEDTHACYWERFGGGYKHPASFIEKSKDKIDTLNAYHIGDDAVTDFTKSIFSIGFYDSMVAFEKRKHGKPYALQTGNQNL